MSEFLHKPDDEMKALIDSMFIEKKEEKPASPSYPNYKLNLPDPPELTKEEEEEYMGVALEEIETIRNAFLDFGDAIANTALYPYLYPHLEDLAIIAQDLGDLVGKNIEKDDLTDSGMMDYKNLMRVRNRILNQIKTKYNK